MNFLDLVNAKRQKNAHSRQEIEFIIESVMNRSVDDCAVTAWLMAVCCNGMTLAETTALTAAMANSGTILDFADETRPIVDKHSTGGVGDKTTLVLVPLLAACGALVPKLSGRALEHTGGTLDKLEAIPGFVTNLPLERFMAQVRTVGAAIASPTEALAPADARLYALRNKTGTVDSVHLGTGSVMSKKIAGGAEFILLDVKCGNGAFMQTRDRAKEIAQIMIDAGKALGRKTRAVITNMDQPLGQAVGNALEVAEAIEVLKGGGPADLKELCLHLGAVTLESVGLAGDAAQARHKVKAALTSGAALLKFKEIVIAQGGDPQVIDNPLALPQANHHLILRLPASASAGWLKAISTKEIGVIARELSKSEKGGSHPNAAAGVLMHVQVGSHVHAGDRLATIYGDSAQSCSSVAGSLQKAFLVSESPVRKPKLILDDIV